MNSALKFIGKPFGYRVYQAILAYMENYPYDFFGDGDHKFYPLVDQIMMRVLPRLEGMDTGDSELEKCIEGIKETLTAAGDQLGIIAILSDYKKTPYFSWKGIDYSGDKNAEPNTKSNPK